MIVSTKRGKPLTDVNWQNNVIDRLRSLEEGQKGLAARLSDVETKNAVDEVHRVNVEHRLEKIEGNTTWLVRLIIGAIIVGMLGLLSVGGG